MVLILKGRVLSVRDIMIKWLDLLNTELLSTQANALHKILNTAPTKSGLFADYLLLWKVWQIILYIKFSIKPHKKEDNMVSKMLKDV